MKPGVRRIILQLAILFFVFIGKGEANCRDCDPANGGNCLQAWRGQAGQFCGHWRNWGDTLPCCCPLNAQCAVTASACKCQRLTFRQPPPQPVHHRSSGGGFFSGSFIFFLLVLCCCCLCCRACCRGNDHDHGHQHGYAYAQADQQATYAYPINYPHEERPPPVVPSYYQASAAPTGYPAYGSTTSGGGYSGTDMLLSGAAGAAGGALLSNLYAGQRDNENRTSVAEQSMYFEGDSGANQGAADVEEFDGDF